jgi:PKD repeat protein
MRCSALREDHRGNRWGNRGTDFIDLTHRCLRNPIDFVYTDREAKRKDEEEGAMRTAWRRLTLVLLLVVALPAVADVVGSRDEIVRFTPGQPPSDPGAAAGGELDIERVDLPPLEDTVDPVGSPPVLVLTATPAEVLTGEIIRFDASGSSDPDGAIVTYQWDLFSSGRFPLRTAGPVLLFPFSDDGTYDVRLRVTDDSGNASTSEPVAVIVANRPPRSSFEASTDSALTGISIRFDASTSEDEDGTIVLYRWDLDGDGTVDREVAEDSISHSFEDDGRFAVQLITVDDDGAEAASETITVRIENRPPTASFSSSPITPTDAQDVMFAANASDRDGEVRRWEWAFGDGDAAANEAPTHRFPDAGEYVVTLVVTDDDGSRSAVASRTVTVTNALPEAVLRVSSHTADVGEDVLFTNLSYDPSSSGEVIHMGLEFGDGTFVSGGAIYGAQYTHAYAEPGEYVVLLYAVDDDGGLDVIQTTIVVD